MTDDEGIMVIISVVDVLNGERFRFPVAQDCYFKVKHLKYEMSLMNRRATDARYLIIRDGEVLDDEEYLVPYGYVAVSTKTQRNPVLEFFLMAQPKQAEKKEKALCFLDEPSIAAAQEWMTSHGAYASEGEVIKRQHILNTLQKLLPATPIDDDTVNPLLHNQDNNGPGGMEGDQGRRPGGGGIQWINMKILTRLGVGFVLFVNGSSASRIKFFFMVSAVYYLVESGIVVHLLKRYLGDLYAPPTPPGPIRPNPINAGAPAPAVPPAAANAAGGGGVGGIDRDAIPVNGQAPGVQPAARQDVPADQGQGLGQGQGNVVGPPQTFVQRLAQQMLQVSHSGAAIPVGRTGGLVTDVVCFVAALFLSLVPEWSPHGHGVVH